MRNGSPIPAEGCIEIPNKTPQEIFKDTCVNWPGNSRPGRSTGGCCYQWVDD
jgi:hypothetical protein